MQLVTVQVFESYVDAHLKKVKLESEGIQVFLHDENLVTRNPLYNFLLGGIKRKVPQSEAVPSREIVTEFENAAVPGGSGEAIKCPKCYSERLYTNF